MLKFLPKFKFYPARALWLLVSLGIIILDQLSKYWAMGALFFEQPKLIIPGVFNFYLDFNQGAAFSFLNHAGFWGGVFFLSLAVLISLICIFILLSKERGPRGFGFFLLGLALIIGGALGNAIDRLRLTHVIDFIQWHWKDYYWPTFNIADSAICLAVFFIILSEILKNKKVSKK